MFADIADCDNAIGHMLETYCGQGLLYVPFETLRRIEVLPRSSFMDVLVPKVKITDASQTVETYVSLLYACSGTSPNQGIRNGGETRFESLPNRYSTGSSPNSVATASSIASNGSARTTSSCSARRRVT